MGEGNEKSNSSMGVRARVRKKGGGCLDRWRVRGVKEGWRGVGRKRNKHDKAKVYESGKSKRGAAGRMLTSEGKGHC